MRRATNVRCCVVCRRAGPKASFWRVVRDHGSGLVQLDEGMGRSAYLCPTADCLKLARKKRRLGRSLRCAMDDGIYDLLEARLEPGQSAPD